MRGQGFYVGGELWAESTGTGSPVVLLHGAGHDSRLWDSVVDGLARRHTVIRYDARGLGRSATPQAPYWDVNDLGAVLDHFDIDRAALVGLSMGGETALDFTLAHGERVTALGLVGASVSGYEWPQTAELTDYAAARRTRDAARLAASELSVWAALGSSAPGGGTIESMIRENAEARLLAEAAMLYPDLDAISRIGRIDCPTLVVYGAHDHPEIGVIAHRLADEIPDARLEVIAGADHYLPLRAPDRLTELLLAHLGQTP